MTASGDRTSGPVPRPQTRRGRWDSFTAPPTQDGGQARGLAETGNPRHRVRVEHDGHTLLVHLSDEDGDGWTTFAVDRVTRAWAVAQRPTQSGAASAAVRCLYGEDAQ